MVNLSKNILTTDEQCSIRCVPPGLKNGQMDAIPVSVGSPWSERKIQPNLSKELAIITKRAVVLRHSKKPWHRGKKKPGV